MVNSEEQLLAILATLEECRAALVTNGNPETAHLVSVAALHVRIKLNGIGEDQLIMLSSQDFRENLRPGNGSKVSG